MGRAALLNLFWGVLTYKKKAEEALEASGMSYCIVRPGGMEVPGDDYKRTHNVVLAKRDTLFGGQVSPSFVSHERVFLHLCWVWLCWLRWSAFASQLWLVCKV